MAKYNKAHALSQFVKDIDEEQRRKKKLQEALDTHKQNSPTSSTSVKGKQIAPIRTDTQYIANRILGGQTIEQRYAPLMNVQETPTTSAELFNKLKEQNQQTANQQQANREETLMQQVEKEKAELGILSKEEINALNKQALSNDKLYSQTIDGKKNDITIDKKEGETDLQAIKRIIQENEKKENEYNKTSKAAKELKEIQGNALGYMAKKTGAGALRGVTGIGQAGLTEQARGMKQGSENKNALNILYNLYNLNPMNASTSAFLEAILNLSKNKDRKVTKKAVDFLIDSADSPMKSANAVAQLQGMVAPKDAYKEVLKQNETISKPSQKLDEKLNEEGQKYSKSVQTTGEVLDVVGNMLPSAAVTAATKNPNIGLATMGLSAKGTSTMEALNNGESLERAPKIGSLKGEIEIGTEIMTGGLKIFGKGALDDIGEKGISKITGMLNKKGLTKASKYVGKLLNVGKDVAGEEIEEIVSDVMNTVIDKNTYNPDAKYTKEDLMHTLGITAGSTLVLNLLTRGLAAGVSKIGKSTNNQVQNIEYTNEDMNNAIAEAEQKMGTQFTPEEKTQIAEVVNEKVNKDASKRISLSEQLENQGTKIMEQAIADENSMIENFKTYLEENDIKNPTQQDIDNSLVDLLGYDNEQTPDERIKTEQKYNKIINEYINDTSYQGTNHSGDKAYGKGITVDNLYKRVDSFADSIKQKKEALSVIEKVKNNPEAKVKIYRATPGDNINAGDWVYLTENEADKFSKSLFSDKRKIGYKVLEMEVKAKDVNWTGKNLEFAYEPQESNNNKAVDVTGRIENGSNLEENSIKYNKKTHTVEINTDVLKNVNKKDWIKTLKNILKTKFSKGIDVDGVNVEVTSKSRNELLSSSYTRWLKNNDFETYSNKMKMLDGLDKIYQNQKNIKREPPKHPRTDDIVAFKRGNINVKMGNTLYNVDVLTGIRNNNGELVYDIVDMKKEDSSIGVYPRSDESSIKNIPQNDQKVNNDISDNSNMQNIEKNAQKAVKKAIAPLHEEVKALRKEISELKQDNNIKKSSKINEQLESFNKNKNLYDDIENDDVIKASIKYEGKFADKSIDQLQQVKQKLNHTIENPFKANTEELNDAKLQYAELTNEFSRRGLDINDTIVEDAIRLMEHKAQKKTKSDKSKATRTPLDFGTLDELQNRAKARKNGELIETLNQMDTEAENKLIEEQNKTKPKKESKLKKALTYGQYLFTNRNVEIDNYAKETGNHNIQVLADQVSNIQTEISNNINNAQTDNNLNTIGKSITQIFSQADKSGLSEAFNDYLFHLSNIERHKWGKGSQVPMVDSFVLTEEYEKTYPEMKQWAKDVNKYNKNLLYKQADAGLITKELADGLSERYEFYVPFMENLEGEYTPDKTNTIKTRSTVKRAKGGSSRNLLGFEEAMIRQTESAISQIRKNQLYQEIVKTKENTTTDFENNTNPDIHDNGLFSDNGKYYLTAYVDGKATQVEIDKTLYHGLAQNGNRMIQQAEQKLSPITKPLQALSSARRNILTTWSPTFLITNPLKDIQDAPLNSKYAKDWVKSMPKSIKEIASGKGGVELENFLNGYGQANLRGDYNLDSGLSDVTKLVDKKSSNKSIGISKKMLKKIPQINEKIELIPRYAEYLASIENGCSQMEALYNAREVTTNFGRGGIITKALNRNGFTFLNANVQGMSKLVRNFSGENGGRAVLGCIAKATALGIAPALLNALFFDDDDDYDVIPDYIKDNYYLVRIDKWNDKYDNSGNIIKGGGSAFLRIPKGRMMSIFGSAARRTLEATKGRENAFEGYLTNAYNQVGVQNPLESNILAPIIQAKNNQTWYGSELVPKRLQTNKQDGTKIPAKQQYDASTDKFSIWLGDKLNISPYKINYVLDQYSGGVGDMILPTITEEAQSDKDDTAGKMIAPLKDKFTADSITDNKYVTNFYSKLEELGEKKNATGSKKDEMSYQYMQNISFEMGALYKEMREVQANTKLADSKKYAKVQNIKAEINKLAEEGMKGYKDVESYDNYARVGDRELYKYQSKNGKTGWSDSNGQYADDINQLGLTTQEKNEYYTTKMKMSDVANGFKEDEGAEKYRAVLKTIRNAKIPSDAKYELYNSWYGKSDEASSVIQDLGISANDYLKFKTADLTSNKNKNGYAIRGSKADKVTSYLNKTNLNKGQKAVLYRLSFSYKGNYSSTKYSNAYNKEIINYIDNSNLTYEESVNALKKLGFKVSKDGTVKWD